MAPVGNGAGTSQAEQLAGEWETQVYPPAGWFSSGMPPEPQPTNQQANTKIQDPLPHNHSPVCSTRPGKPWASTASCLIAQPHPVVAGSLHTMQFGNQLDKGTAHTYQTTHGSQSHTTEGPLQPT